MVGRVIREAKVTAVIGEPCPKFHPRRVKSVWQSSASRAVRPASGGGDPGSQRTQRENLLPDDCTVPKSLCRPLVRRNLDEEKGMKKIGFLTLLVTATLLLTLAFPAAAGPNAAAVTPMVAASAPASAAMVAPPGPLHIRGSNMPARLCALLATIWLMPRARSTVMATRRLSTSMRPSTKRKFACRNRKRAVGEIFRGSSVNAASLTLTLKRWRELSGRGSRLA